MIEAEAQAPAKKSETSEKQSKADEARSLYEKVLQLEATNKTALKRLAILERRSGREAGEKGKAS